MIPESPLAPFLAEKVSGFAPNGQFLLEGTNSRSGLIYTQNGFRGLFFARRGQVILVVLQKQSPGSSIAVDDIKHRFSFFINQIVTFKGVGKESQYLLQFLCAFLGQPLLIE